MLPRQLTLFPIAVVFLLQDTVFGWIFPKTQTHLKLPLDLSAFFPFYQVLVLLEETDNNPQIQFSSRRVNAHVQINRQSKNFRKKFFEIDATNGTLWLTQRPIDLDVSRQISMEKRTHRILVNFTIFGKEKDAISAKKMEMSLEFSGSLKTFCQHSQCFQNHIAKYKISEKSVTSSEVDRLPSAAYLKLCPIVELYYNSTPANSLLHVNSTSGTIYLMKQPDAEKSKFATFNVSCFMLDKMYTMVVEVDVIDIDDNAPTTQTGKTIDYKTFNLKPNVKSLKFDVSVIDKDSKEVNNLMVRIENDTQNLFLVKETKIYGEVGRGINTFVSAEIESKAALFFPDKEYNFTIVFEDISLNRSDRQVVYYISLINNTDVEPLPQNHHINISRAAAQFSRIIQLSPIPFIYEFQFAVGTEHNDWIGITKNSGIVYVKEQIPHAGIIKREIKWNYQNHTHSKDGSIYLTVNVEDASPIKCRSKAKWCSYNANNTECNQACGVGSRLGRCSWRFGSLTKSSLSSEYATCSPDLTHCPDKYCDELEELERTLCPQDCEKRYIGEAIMSKSGRGIESAIGICSCPIVGQCKCGYPYPPAEVIQKEYHNEKITYPTFIDFVNESLVEENILSMDAEIETSSVGTALFEDGYCGPNCIMFAASIPFMLLFCVVIMLIFARMKRNGLSKHTFIRNPSSSGVPSDYVDELSSSAQDSRNISNNTPSPAKTSNDAKWEFPRNRLQFESILGEGEFGRVMKAKALNISGVQGFTTVAVKILKENFSAEDRQDLMMEYMLLKEISHPNVIRLLGVSTEKNENLYLIVEFAELGSLKSYLRKQRRRNSCCRYNSSILGDTENAQSNPEYYEFNCERSRIEPRHNYYHKEQMSFAWQIAKGMAHLSHMKLVHRDLAARNVLLSKQKVVKISDFGLSRDVYEGEMYLKRSRTKVPVKWMAIESLEDQVYTTRSDVWSYGVVLWEIMMHGASPYPGVSPQRLYNLLKAGYRMSKPDNCSDEIYHVMRLCWRTQPRERPSFKDLVLKLEQLLHDTVEYMDFSLKYKFSPYQDKRLVIPEEVIPMQYISVFVNDEEESSSQEKNEDIGLKELFLQSEKPTVFSDCNQKAGTSS